MQRNYNVTGEDRKRMVAIISQETGQQAVYTRMPECAYIIGDFKVGKTGELIWEEGVDAERIMTALTAAGFAGTDVEAVDTEQEPVEDNTAEEPTGLTISFPRADFTEMALDNMRALIAAKQTLIRKALQADRTDVEIDDEKVSFPWWDQVGTPEQVTAYTEFLTALVKMAKEAKRVTAKERETESEKYSFRTFLLRLGFIGAEHKKTRAVLMEHLSGHAAFKNQADADAFYARLKAKKAAAKAATETVSTEPTEALITTVDESMSEEADDEISE